MKTPIVSKFILLFVFSIVLQSCTADALPGDPAANPEKTVVKPTNVSAEVAGELIIPKTKG